MGGATQEIPRGAPRQGALEPAPETKQRLVRFLDLSGAGRVPGKGKGAGTAAGSGGLSTERRSACPVTPSYLFTPHYKRWKAFLEQRWGWGVG